MFSKRTKEKANWNDTEKNKNKNFYNGWGYSSFVFCTTMYAQVFGILV